MLKWSAFIRSTSKSDESDGHYCGPIWLMAAEGGAAQNFRGRQWSANVPGAALKMEVKSGMQQEIHAGCCSLQWLQ